MPIKIDTNAFVINLLYFWYLVFQAQISLGFPQIVPVAGGSVSGGHATFNQSASNDDSVVTTGNNTASSVSSLFHAFKFGTAHFVFDGAYDILDFYPGFTDMGIDLLVGYMSTILSGMNPSTVIAPRSSLIVYNFPVRATLNWVGAQDRSWTADTSAHAMEEFHGSCPEYFKDHLRMVDARINQRPVMPSNQVTFKTTAIYDSQPATLVLEDGFELLVKFATEDQIPSTSVLQGLSACYRKYQGSPTIPPHWPEFFYESGVVIGFYVIDELPSGDPLPTAILFKAINALREDIRFHKRGRWTGFQAKLNQRKSQIAEISLSPFQMGRASTT